MICCVSVVTLGLRGWVGRMACLSGCALLEASLELSRYNVVHPPVSTLQSTPLVVLQTSNPEPWSFLLVEDETH